MPIHQKHGCVLYCSFQGDCRTYNYVAGLSTDSTPNWENLFTLAKIIPRVCTNVNRLILLVEIILIVQLLSRLNSFAL